MMVFPYKAEQRGHPLVSLQGRTDRPRPLVPVTILGPSKAILRMALLDTGADDTTFPAFLASALGIDLTNAPVGGGSAVAGNRLPVRYAQVTLRLAAQRERREWRAWVGFTSAPMRHLLLGYAGCMQFFDVHFRGAREEVELTVNPSYPGT